MDKSSDLNLLREVDVILLGEVMLSLGTSRDVLEDMFLDLPRVYVSEALDELRDVISRIKAWQVDFERAETVERVET